MVRVDRTPTPPTLPAQLRNRVFGCRNPRWWCRWHSGCWRCNEPPDCASTHLGAFTTRYAAGASAQFRTAASAALQGLPALKRGTRYASCCRSASSSSLHTLYHSTDARFCAPAALALPPLLPAVNAFSPVPLPLALAAVTLPLNPAASLLAALCFALRIRSIPSVPTLLPPLPATARSPTPPFCYVPSSPVYP